MHKVLFFLTVKLKIDYKKYSKLDGVAQTMTAPPNGNASPLQKEFMFVFFAIKHR